MTEYTYLNNANPQFIDALYQDYLENPENVDSKWRQFFEGFELGIQSGSTNINVTDKVAKTIPKRFNKKINNKKILSRPKILKYLKKVFRFI